MWPHVGALPSLSTPPLHGYYFNLRLRDCFIYITVTRPVRGHNSRKIDPSTWNSSNLTPNI